MAGVYPLEESLLRAGIFLYILNVHYYNKIALRNKGVKAKSQQEIVKTLKCVIIVIELDEKTDGGTPLVYDQQGLS